MNLLLRALPPSDAAMLDRMICRTDLRPGEQIVTAGGHFSRIVFPDTATVMLSLARPEAKGVAIGVVGREGMIGWPALLGCASSPFGAAATQAGGLARTIDIAAFKSACAASPALHAMVLGFAHVMTVQLSSSALCAIQGSVAQRLARWLLMLHDRQDGDELVLTHDTLALDLGIRRASVTDCLHLLEGDHVVRCTRGRLMIRDRAALEQAAGAAYGVAEAEHAAMLPPHPSIAAVRSRPVRCAFA